MNKFNYFLILLFFFASCSNKENINSTLFLENRINSKIERINKCSKQDDKKNEYAKNVHKYIQAIIKDEKLKNNMCNDSIKSLFEYLDNNNLNEFEGYDIIENEILTIIDDVKKFESEMLIQKLLLLELSVLEEINDWQYDEMYKFDYIRIVSSPIRNNINYGDLLEAKIFIIPSDKDSLSFFPIIDNDTLSYWDENKDCFKFSSKNYSHGKNVKNGKFFFQSKRMNESFNIPFSIEFVVK